MNTVGFEEPHLRRRENKNFSFERNKTEEVEEALLMNRILAVSSFTAGKSPQPDSSPLFGDPLSSNPLNKKLKSEFISADLFLKKDNVVPISTDAPFNPSSSVSISFSSPYSSTKSGSRANFKRKKYAKIFPHYLKPFLKYFIWKKKSKKIMAKFLKSPVFRRSSTCFACGKLVPILFHQLISAAPSCF